MLVLLRRGEEEGARAGMYGVGRDLCCLARSMKFVTTDEKMSWRLVNSDVKKMCYTLTVNQWGFYFFIFTSVSCSTCTFITAIHFRCKKRKKFFSCFTLLTGVGGSVRPNCPKTMSIPPFPCAQIQPERARPYARAPPVSLCHLPTSTKQQPRAPREDYSSQPRRASFPSPPPPPPLPNAQTKRRRRRLPAQIQWRPRPRARLHAAIRAPDAMRADLSVGGRAGHCLVGRRLGRGVCVHACGGPVRRAAGWSFAVLGASRFGLRLGDGLCGLERGARCGGELVRVGLLFIFFLSELGE